jgi:hypothetical protein
MRAKVMKPSIFIAENGKIDTYNSGKMLHAGKKMSFFDA